ncbi:hypothetical protein DUNSADRAFT_18 [Dunaliella salina]|uniref:Uncharacterized protein n=1 Tax=Dunaliella salina TaxID=3046 RepID=A0ABQ7HAL4_DUNSA|nr:hypothetical protein DUNSADRAFT_18 [Dunaliella salina]|eukprot:KAF5843896.1 hypothetical protein DUNSADRAFT_18 [Dunaliella salina]
MCTFFSHRIEVRPREPVSILGPSDDERQKRRLWAQEKARREAARQKRLQEMEDAAIAKKRADQEAALEKRRAEIRERIAAQHEAQARAAKERKALEKHAKQDNLRFRRPKPLHEKVSSRVL